MEHDEILENQRYIVGLGWVKTSALTLLDWSPWSTKDGQPVELDDTPQADGSNGWHVYQSRSTDYDGWLYAFKFSQLNTPRPGGRASRRPTDLVRSRIWQKIDHAEANGTNVACATTKPRSQLHALPARLEKPTLGRFWVVLLEMLRQVQQRRRLDIAVLDPAALFAIVREHAVTIRHQQLSYLPATHPIWPPLDPSPPPPPTSTPSTSTAPQPPSPPSRTPHQRRQQYRLLLKDLHCAAVHSRAAYGYLMAEGHLSSVTSFAAMHLHNGMLWDILGGVSHEAHTQALQELTGVCEADVLEAVWDSTTNRPCHYLVIDRARRRVVLSVRGSVDWGDICTDLNGAPMEVGAELGGADGQVHPGLMSSALYIQGRTLEGLKVAAEKVPGWPVLVTGHSLGGGVAALVAMLMHQPGALPEGVGPVRCIGIGPAAVLSENLARSCRDYVASVILQSDMVPRLSMHSVERLLLDMHRTSFLSRLRSAWTSLTASPPHTALPQPPSPPLTGASGLQQLLSSSESELLRASETADTTLHDTPTSTVLDRLPSPRDDPPNPTTTPHRYTTEAPFLSPPTSSPPRQTYHRPTYLPTSIELQPVPPPTSPPPPSTPATQPTAPAAPPPHKHLPPALYPAGTVLWILPGDLDATARSSTSAAAANAAANTANQADDIADAAAAAASMQLDPAHPSHCPHSHSSDSFLDDPPSAPPISLPNHSSSTPHIAEHSHPQLSQPSPHPSSTHSTTLSPHLTDPSATHSHLPHNPHTTPPQPPPDQHAPGPPPTLLPTSPSPDVELASLREPHPAQHSEILLAPPGPPFSHPTPPTYHPHHPLLTPTGSNPVQSHAPPPHTRNLTPLLLPAQAPEVPLVPVIISSPTSPPPSLQITSPASTDPTPPYPPTTHPSPPPPPPPPTSLPSTSSTPQPIPCPTAIHPLQPPAQPPHLLPPLQVTATPITSSAAPLPPAPLTPSNTSSDPEGTSPTALGAAKLGSMLTGGLQKLKSNLQQAFTGQAKLPPVVVKADGRCFSQLLLSTAGIQNHIPDSYLDAVEELLAAEMEYQRQQQEAHPAA